MGSDPQYAKYPDLSLAQHIFVLTNPSSSKANQQTSLNSLQNAISEHSMAPLYRHLAHPVDGLLNASGEGTVSKPANAARSAASKASESSSMQGKSIDFPWNEKLYEELKAKNEKELEGFQKEEEEAAEKAGDTEVQAARGKRAEFWARVCDKVWNSIDSDS
jgi:26S proteasome regulatory subunit N7